MSWVRVFRGNSDVNLEAARVHMWYQVLIGAHNVLAQMWAEKPPVLLDLLVGVPVVPRLRLNLEYLAHAFHGVQVENHVVLSP